MNLVRTTALIVLALFQSAVAQRTPANPNNPVQSTAGLPDGEFIGLQKLEGISPDEPHARWFHENTLIIRGTEVILDMNPVVFHNGKKEYSASDGGFLTYRGRLFSKKGQLFVSLRLFQSDYVLFSIGPAECEPYSRLFVYPVRRLNGVIEINGVRYKPASPSRQSLNQLLQWLRDEPDEYNGKHPYRSDSHAPPCKP